jgi:hypothetical protein
MAYGPGNLSRRVARQRDELVAPGLDWTYGVVVTGDRRRGQTVQPAVMAIGRPISAVAGSYIRVHYLTVSGWWPR